MKFKTFAFCAVCFGAGIALSFAIKDTPEPAPAPAPIAEISHSNRITSEVVGVMRNEPDTDHVLTGISSSGAVEVICAIPCCSSWPADGTVENQISSDIQAALDRGVLAFQLIILDPNPGAIAEK